MIIPANVLKENHFYKICSKTNEIYNELFSSQKDKSNGGIPKEYTDLQIVKCKLYMVMNNIYCLRELEWELFNDRLSASIIGLNDIPDHSTLSIRFTELEKSKFEKLYDAVVNLLAPNIRVYSIDSTSLRILKYDSEAKYGTSTGLRKYKGYKLHLISSNDSIPLPMFMTTLLLFVKNYDPFILLGDAAYDSTKLFELANDLGFTLLTDINYRNADSIYDFTD